MVACSKIEFNVPCIALLCLYAPSSWLFVSVLHYQEVQVLSKRKVGFLQLILLFITCAICDAWSQLVVCVIELLRLEKTSMIVHPSWPCPPCPFYGWEGAREKRCLREAAGCNWAKSCGIALHSLWGRKPVGFPGQDSVSLVLQWVPKAGHSLCVLVGHDRWMWNLWMSTKLSPKPHLAGGSAVCSTDSQEDK